MNVRDHDYTYFGYYVLQLKDYSKTKVNEDLSETSFYLFKIFETTLIQCEFLELTIHPLDVFNTSHFVLR